MDNIFKNRKLAYSLAEYLLGDTYLARKILKEYLQTHSIEDATVDKIYKWWIKNG